MKENPQKEKLCPLRYIPGWLRVLLGFFIGRKFVNVGSKYALWQHVEKESRLRKTGASTMGFLPGTLTYYIGSGGKLEEKKLIVKRGYDTTAVRMSGIAWVHNTHDRGEVHLKNGSVFRQDEPLHKLITQFPYPRFCKVNRWYILNRDVVKEVYYWLNKRKGLLIILDAPYHLKIKVSPQQADEVKKWAGELLRLQRGIIAGASPGSR